MDRLTPAVIEEEKINEFATEYIALVKKHNMYIANCSCCTVFGWVNVLTPIQTEEIIEDLTEGLSPEFATNEF